MPNKPAPIPAPKVKRPKARVMFAAKPELADCFVVMESPRQSSSSFRCSPLAVIPTATRKQAQQIVSWANLSREQKEARIDAAIHSTPKPNYSFVSAKENFRQFQIRVKAERMLVATAILNLTEGPAP